LLLITINAHWICAMAALDAINFPPFHCFMVIAP
jgi:hypothetical protein